MKIDKLLKRYRIEHGKHFRLKDHDPADTHGLGSELKPQAKKLLADGVKELSRLQDVLAAQDRWGLLLIFQAMDAAGKDGTIKHVMSGVNPQGVDVSSFKAPSAEELHHGYLWRCMKCVPGRGRIGIFNRSYYEEVLVVRIHPEILESQKLPKRWSRNISGRSALKISAISSTTLHGTALRWLSSSCISQRKSRGVASWGGWTRRTRTGSFPHSM
jgi:polyphosphate kinase 2 (PPK2 family)